VEPGATGGRYEANKDHVQFGLENGHIDKPVHDGAEFKPDKATMEKHRAETGPKMPEADQLRQLLDALKGKEIATSDAAELEMVKLETDAEDHAEANIGFRGQTATNLAPAASGRC